MKRTIFILTVVFASVLVWSWGTARGTQALSPYEELLLYMGITHDGISLDFTKSIENGGCCYVKAPGAPAQRGKFTDLFTFTRASSATFLGSNGLIQTATSNVPRIEFDTSGNVLGLVNEGTSVNYILQSEDFTTTWANTNTTDAANTAVAPDGNTTADTITATAANGTITQNFQAAASNTIRVFGVYLKRLTGTGDVTVEVGRTASSACTVNTSWNRCFVADTGLNGTYAVVANLATVTATGHGLNTGDSTRLDYTSGTAADFSCASVITLTADTFTCAQTTADTTGNVTVYAAVGRIKIATNTDAVYAWGGQGETAGSQSVNPITSYIPTTTATVTRASDIAIRTLGPEYNQTSGTVIARICASSIGGSNWFRIDDTTGNNGIQSSVNTSLQLSGSITTATVSQFSTGVANSIACRGRVGFAWETNNIALIADGNTASGAFDTSATIPVITRLGFMGNQVGNFVFNGRITNFDYYPYRQPNSFLRQKTQPGSMQ